MKKPKTESNTRKNLLKFADLIGAREDLERKFREWDVILAQMPPGEEKKAAARMAILDVQQLLDIHADKHDGLTIGGEVVIPAATGGKG